MHSYAIQIWSCLNLYESVAISVFSFYYTPRHTGTTAKNGQKILAIAKPKETCVRSPAWLAIRKKNANPVTTKTNHIIMTKINAPMPIAR